MNAMMELLATCLNCGRMVEVGGLCVCGVHHEPIVSQVYASVRSDACAQAKKIRKQDNWKNRKKGGILDGIVWDCINNPKNVELVIRKVHPSYTTDRIYEDGHYLYHVEFITSKQRRLLKVKAW